jgi:hypothetical protein
MFIVYGQQMCSYTLKKFNVTVNITNCTVVEMSDICHVAVPIYISPKFIHNNITSDGCTLVPSMLPMYSVSTWTGLVTKKMYIDIHKNISNNKTLKYNERIIKF